MKAELICWHCGAATQTEIPHPPQFAFEMVGWAKEVGMTGYFDMRYGRALLFCNPDHARAEMTKKGTFRFRAKGTAIARAEGRA